jgi:TP901 family phage tail tape measure protein
LADFRINVIVDPSRVPRGTRPVTRQLSRIEAQANRVRKTLGLTFAALAGGAVIFGAIRNMANFQESIAVVRAVTKATSEEFEVLRDRAQELGITTRFSATQAADAMVLLARAGFSVAETMEAVGQTLLLAQAGGLQMAEAADITASTLRGFQLEARETARVTDVLTETANSANTNVSQLGQALKFVAPIAKGLNQSLEITNAALGTLSDAGLKGTLAGTGLRRVLAELASPGRELADILDAAALSTEAIDPKVVSLTDSLEALKLAGAWWPGLCCVGEQYPEDPRAGAGSEEFWRGGGARREDHG